MAKAKSIEAVGSDGAKMPKFGTARPASDGTVPRILDPLERVPAGSGLARFKISAREVETVAVRYVLAKQKDEAEKLVRKELSAVLLAADKCQLVTTALED